MNKCSECEYTNSNHRSLLGLAIIRGCQGKAEFVRTRLHTWKNGRANSKFGGGEECLEVYFFLPITKKNWSHPNCMALCPSRLRLVRATPWAKFVVFSASLV